MYTCTTTHTHTHYSKCLSNTHIIHILHTGREGPGPGDYHSATEESNQPPSHAKPASGSHSVCVHTLQYVTYVHILSTFITIGLFLSLSLSLPEVATISYAGHKAGREES